MEMLTKSELLDLLGYLKLTFERGYFSENILNDIKPIYEKLWEEYTNGR